MAVSSIGAFRARAAAQSVAALTIARLWGDFEATAGSTAQMWQFRAHLDTLGLTDQSSTMRPVKRRYLSDLNLASHPSTGAVVDGVEIERVNIFRLDEWNATSLIVEVSAIVRTGGAATDRVRRSSIQETFTVAPPEWNGLDYALLANNISCLLCHTTVDSAERFYNRDVALTGTFAAVRMGSIESVHFREDPDSRIAGVTLVGGDATMRDGGVITDWSAFSLMTARQENGLLVEDAFGKLTFEALTLYDPSAPEASANLLLHLHAPDAATVHTLPQTFPSPIPDNGGIDAMTGAPCPEFAGNRVIDDSEFALTVRGLGGTLSGGTISVIAPGIRIASSGALDDMLAGNVPSVGTLTRGNVYLHGTESRPLLLAGDVAIDGDVIIGGFVKGRGTLRARGNVYVTSDLVYADAGGPSGESRTFGLGPDGVENSLALAAGGNIVIGDFYRPAWGAGEAADGTSNTSFNFTMEQLAIFNRMEWMKTVATLPGERERVVTGTRTIWYDERRQESYEEEVDRWVWRETGAMVGEPVFEWREQTNGLPAPYTETWSERVVVGHREVPEMERVRDGTESLRRQRWIDTGVRLSREEEVWEWQTPQLANPYFDPSQRARYYSFSYGSPVAIFNGDGFFDPVTGHWHSAERAGGWNSEKLTYADPANDSDPLLYGTTGKPTAVISTIAPTDDWIDGDSLRDLIQRELANRASGSLTLEIDATLYSANSIIGIVPDRDCTDTDGTLLINGAVVAADVAFLAPNGTRVNYDARGARALAITADVGLTITRRVSAPMPPR